MRKPYVFLSFSGVSAMLKRYFSSSGMLTTVFFFKECKRYKFLILLVNPFTLNPIVTSANPRASLRWDKLIDFSIADCQKKTTSSNCKFSMLSGGALPEIAESVRFPSDYYKVKIFVCEKFTELIKTSSFSI